MMLRLLAIVTALGLTTVLPAAHADRNVWVDGLSLSLGNGVDPGDTTPLRLGMQKRWHHNWFTGGAWYLGGYWDTELARMKAGNTVYGISLTPVLRYQRDVQLSSGFTPFAEAGVGPHLLSATHLGGNDLSTALQVGSLLGLGIGFGDKGQYELSYRYTHITNLGLNNSNDGLSLHLFKLGYNFN